MEIEPRHQCLIYEGSPSLQLPILASMIQKKLHEGYRCLYLNSRPMVAGLRSYIAAMGVDVADEVAQGRLILSSESAVSGDGGFDIQAMLQMLEDSLDQALHEGYIGLWATGDMTFEFGSEKNFSKLMEYEYGLEKLFQRRSELKGICQYHTETLTQEGLRQSLRTHQVIFINETLSHVSPYYTPCPSNVVPSVPPDISADTKMDQMIATLCQLQSASLP